MKKLFPILLLAAAAFYFVRSKRTYKVMETDGSITYIILKDGATYWQFGIPTSLVGSRVTIPQSASVGSAYDYARLTGAEYAS